MGNKLILIFVFCGLVSLAQKDAEQIYEGNKLYHSGKIAQSAPLYSKALELNPNNRKANFNLGDALYKNAMEIKKSKMRASGQKMSNDSIANMLFDQAAQNFALVANSVSDKDTLHRAWHNIGNCYLQKREFKQAVEAYKKSLRYDPKDEETRYNLAYALKNLPKEEKGGGGQQQQQQDQQQDQQKKQQKQEQQMDKQQAEQLLKALMDQEKKLQEKRKQSSQTQQRDVDKDW